MTANYYGCVIKLSLKLGLGLYEYLKAQLMESVETIWSFIKFNETYLNEVLVQVNKYKIRCEMKSSDDRWKNNENLAMNKYDKMGQVGWLDIEEVVHLDSYMWQELCFFKGDVLTGS